MKTTVKIVGGADLAKRFDELKSAVSQEIMRRAVMAGSMVIQSAAKEKVPKKTRSLGRSIHTEVAMKSSTHAEGEIGTDLVYAAIHEFGGVIRPKKGKYLAIPASEEGEQYVGPRSFPRPLHFIPTVSGGILADEYGNVHYSLRKRVVIPARPYLRPAFEENELQAIGIMERVIRAQLELV